MCIVLCNKSELELVFLQKKENLIPVLAIIGKFDAYK